MVRYIIIIQQKDDQLFTNNSLNYFRGNRCKAYGAAIVWSLLKINSVTILYEFRPQTVDTLYFQKRNIQGVTFNTSNLHSFA